MDLKLLWKISNILEEDLVIFGVSKYDEIKKLKDYMEYEKTID